jgi:hypothetical protein
VPELKMFFQPKSKAVLAGIAMAAALVVGQQFDSAKRFEVSGSRTTNTAGQTTTQSIGSNGQTISERSSTAALPGRVFTIHAGRFQLPLRELPMIGSAQAPKIMVSLFDYTCHYCRDLHGLLLEAQQRFSAELGIVNLPMPLDATCNRLLRATQGPHVNACEYARLGLAVWRADRTKAREFDAWLFEKPSPPPAIPEARKQAEHLVGAEKLEQALADPWIEKQIQLAIAIYDTNSRMSTRGGRMPQLVIGGAVSAGPIDKIDDLYKLLEDHLGLSRNAISGQSK